MSPRNEEQNALIKDERREQIMTAALRVFAAKGFAATKIGDIAARAGMSHGLVYHYFKSKEEIFHEILKRAMQTSAQSLLTVEALPIGPLEKVRQTARYILGGISGYEDSAYYFLIVLHAAVMEAPQETRELVDGSDIAVKALVRILEEGQRLGEVRTGSAMGMALTFFAAIEGLAVYKLTIKDFVMPDPELLVNMVKKQGE